MNITGIFKKSYLVGLDIGSSSIKFAQFVEKEDGLHLVRADLKEIGISKDDVSREEEIASVLTHLFKGIDINKSKVIVTVNCPQTSVKKITTPYMPKSELRQGIMLEIKNYFPFAIDDSILDFEVLEEIENKGVRQYEVLLNVCPRKTVQKNISILNKAKIKPYSVVGSSYVLQRSAWHIVPSAGPDHEEDAKCLIDIGESHTELVIGKGRMLMFARKIPVTGSDFTKAMTGVLVSDRGKMQLSPEEAEKIKREAGIPQERESRIIGDKISTKQIRAMLMSPLEQLTSEIERCFSYYREDSGGGSINSVILFGGGASLKGLAGYLSKELEINVSVGNSFEALSVEKGAIPQGEDISNRMELAINAVLNEERGINLLPPEIKDEKFRVVKRGMIEAVATAVILVSALLFIGMRIKIGNFDKRIYAAKMELSGLQPEVNKAEAKKMAAMVLAEEPYWQDVFREIGSIIPNEVYINNIKMENNIITMKGIAASQDGQQIISDMIIKLEEGLFNNVKLVEGKDLADKSGIEFELRCWLDRTNAK